MISLITTLLHLRIQTHGLMSNNRDKTIVSVRRQMHLQLINRFQSCRSQTCAIRSPVSTVQDSRRRLRLLCRPLAASFGLAEGSTLSKKSLQALHEKAADAMQSTGEGVKHTCAYCKASSLCLSASSKMQTLSMW